MKIHGRMKCALFALMTAASIVEGPLTGSALAASTGSTGGGQAIGTLQPSLALQYLIAHQGLTSGPEAGGASAGGAIMIGEVRLFAGSTVPAGFFAADGAFVTIASTPGLYSVIGTNYGGDGVTTFRLPDLRGRAFAGYGQGPGLNLRPLGSTFGSETVTQPVAQLPSHTHTVPGSSAGLTGGGQALPTIQPTLALSPLINPFGTFEYLSEIRLFAGSYTPGSWFRCQGQLLLILEYDTLYTFIGTTYGGDGTTTFALPDQQGRVSIESGTGPGLSSHVTGEGFGLESVTLSASQMPSHTHALTSGTTGSTGGSLGSPNHQPTLTLRYAIAVSGVFPSPTTPNLSATPTIGEIRPFAAHAPLPSGWTYADGQLLTVGSNPLLSAVIGNAFGGDGVSNFRLPDLRGRTPIGTGQGTGLTNRLRGEQTGTESTSVTVAQMAAHTHVIDPAGVRRPGEPSATGTLLMVRKNVLDPTKIDLSWGTGCVSGATGYAVYQGALSTFTSHAIFNGACGVAGTSLNGQTSGAGNRYYLVSAVDDVSGEEGSLGHNSSGGEIARPAVPCRPFVDLGPCI